MQARALIETRETRYRGDAVRIRQEAEAYRAEIIARATGDADRFNEVYKAFKTAQDVTMQRLYIETMEEILKNSNKVIIDRSAEGGSGVLPYLPLPSLPAFNTPASNPPAAGGAPATSGTPSTSSSSGQPSVRRP